MEKRSLDDMSPGRRVGMMATAAMVLSIITDKDLCETHKKERLLMFSCAAFTAWNSKFGTNFDIPKESLSEKIDAWWSLIDEHGADQFAFNWADLMDTLISSLKELTEARHGGNLLDLLKSRMTDERSDRNSESEGIDKFKIYKGGTGS